MGSRNLKYWVLAPPGLTHKVMLRALSPPYDGNAWRRDTNSGRQADHLPRLESTDALGNTTNIPCQTRIATAALESPCSGLYCSQLRQSDFCHSAVHDVGQWQFPKVRESNINPRNSRALILGTPTKRTSPIYGSSQVQISC